jgi:hypothetical protein
MYFFQHSPYRAARFEEKIYREGEEVEKGREKKDSRTKTS